MRVRSLAAVGTAAVVSAVLAVVAVAAPAQAKWLTSSDPSESVNASLRVDDSPKVGPNGWRVTWNVQITCPKGKRITGQVLLAERDPASIPALAGEDQGITATRDLQGTRRCTGHRQTLHLTLRVRDTTYFDPAVGDTVTVHARINQAASNRTTASVQLFSPQAPEDGGFFVQYCAAPNCASESGPRVVLK